MFFFNRREWNQCISGKHDTQIHLTHIYIYETIFRLERCRVRFQKDISFSFKLSQTETLHTYSTQSIYLCKHGNSGYSDYDL